MSNLKTPTLPNSKQVLTLINGEESQYISVFDRSVQFGDALFDTSKIRDGMLLNWRAHWQRLTAGMKALAMPRISEDTLIADMKQAYRLYDRAQAVCKIIITRGMSVRGYATADVPPKRIVQLHPLPTVSSKLAACLSSVQLPIDPFLAQCKHTNRLHQVLAYQTVGKGFDDAVLCDTNGFVRCGISANVFVRFGDQLVTPPVDDCGVAGTVRHALLHAMPHILVKALTPSALLEADALYLTNSIQGIRQVEVYDDGNNHCQYQLNHSSYQVLCQTLSAYERRTGLRLASVD